MNLRVFVSTQETQGQRGNDFCFVPEGELLIPPVITCSGETADDRCGCARSMCGIETHKSTTTMKVVEFDGSILKLEQIIRISLDGSGWLQHGIDPTEEVTKNIIAAAETFPVGTIVEYRDGVFAARSAQQVQA